MKTNLIPDWKLERYLLGELPAEEIERVRALEEADPGVRARAEALRADNAAILGRYPPETFARKIENAAAAAAAQTDAPKLRAAARRLRTANARTNATKRGVCKWNVCKWNVGKWAVPAAVCAAALLIVPTRLTPPAAQADAALTDADRVKGTTQTIEVWRKNGAAAEKLPQDAAARSGDLVQLRYNVPEFCYGALVSVDGRGVLTVHLSGDSGKAAPLTPGRPIALNNSYQLDDAPLFETFYLVTAKDAFDMESVTRLLKSANHPIDRMGEQILAEDRMITAFTLRKI